MELDRRTSEGEPNLKIERIGNKRQIFRRAPQDDDMGATGNSKGAVDGSSHPSQNRILYIVILGRAL